MNAYVADVVAGKYPAPKAGLEGTIYNPKAAKPWAESDSLMLGQLESYDLAYDSDAEITSSMIDQAVAAKWGSDPLRQNLNLDLQLTSPQDMTTTISGWTGADGTRASGPGAGHVKADPELMKLLKADRKVVTGMGDDHNLYPERGSNNWIIGPSLSKTGNVLVANDTHLGLTNPSTFYIVHLNATDPNFPMDVMGESFPGIPGVILGMTQHTAWGATVSNIDVTRRLCRLAHVVRRNARQRRWRNFRGAVHFVQRRIGRAQAARSSNSGLASAERSRTRSTLRSTDDPNHGPIIPRPNATHNGIEPLGNTELSVKYTGYTPAQLVRYVFGLDRAASMKDMLAALDQDFNYGGQNWVIGDDQGNFGWSEYVQVPRRASATLLPWKILPGDGTDEWVGFLDPKYIPHAYNPAAGFLATANADPIGVSLTNSPFLGQPTGDDGLPLYLGWDYDPGTRVGRITKRIQSATAGGAKVALDDLQDIQADAVTEWGQAMTPTFLSAADALQAEITTPGTNPDLSTLAASPSVTTQVKAVLPTAISLLTNWTFDTPSGATDPTAPTTAELNDSKAALIYHSWYANFQSDAIGDELGALDVSMSETFALKLMAKSVHEPERARRRNVDHGRSDFVRRRDDGRGRRKALHRCEGAGLKRSRNCPARLGNDASLWTWGQVHTLTLDFFSATLGPTIPASGDKTYPNGFPRHGAPGTVDVGGSAASTTDFTYTSGPAIRFVCELTKTGPVARNVLPGGTIYDPASPHYRRSNGIVASQSDLRFGLPRCGRHRERAQRAADEQRRPHQLHAPDLS